MPIFTVTVPAGWTVRLDKKEARSVLMGAGREVAAKARALIQSGGKKRISAPGMPPVSRTGKLVRSIRVRPWRDGDGVSIRDVMYYALFLEKGARGGVGSGKKGVKGRRNKRGAVVGQRLLQPHPFMEPALNAVVGNGLAERMRDAYESGLRFKRGK